ncbi:hypothetical protein [Glaciecola petra]|uniref:Chromosome partition protein Smc n=1 Tax=Glaciecola petra TaxID=3075602 RepID=A0ABU2ZN88_9ALTE|nr:hypothetical protein [Aestuariibacter sp. P117]MDT0594093.1 hypothetical protein [Aestuariibacter sp. P117]
MSGQNKDKDFAPINVDVNDRIPVASPRNASKGTTQGNSKNSSGLTVIALLVALAACGASGFLYTLHEKNLALIDEKEKRLLSLENRLSATGEEMGNSTIALQVKVTELSEKSEELWEQMDKLWASAWRRNQTEIKSLSEEAKKSQREVSGLINTLKTQVASNQSSIGTTQQRIDSVNSKVSAQANEMLSATVNQEAVQENINQQDRKIREMAEKIILLERRNTNLLKELQEIESRLNAVINRTV